MKLCLRNIGKIHSACVEINGITVIAGENNSGKSTVGKALFAIFNSLYHSEKKISTERVNNIENLLQMLYRDVTGGFLYELDEGDLVRTILAHAESHKTIESLTKAICETITHYDEKLSHNASETEISEFSERIATNLQVEDDIIFRTVLQRRLNAEFNEQISNQFVTGELSEITLDVRNEQVSVFIDNDRVLGLNKRISLGTEAIYIDDPFVLDEVPGRIWRGNRYADHRSHLKEKLYISSREANVVEEIVATNKLDSIYDKISVVCSGEVVRGKRATLNYRIAGTDKNLDVRNLSTGLKTFVILKLLLVNGRIEPNGTIILDEPEIHLHPAWQLLFAELIVLLHREFGLHILLNTHSPYFLNAIEVYSTKYGVSEKCKYYLTRDIDGVSYVKDVTNNIEEIYEKLARPLQVLENERYYDD